MTLAAHKSAMVRVDHIYGQTYTGTVGALQSSGRVFKHSVDTSAGDSGAPVYAYLDSARR